MLLEMAYLITSIFFLILIALVFRRASDTGVNPFGMNLMFRVSAGLMAVLVLLFAVDMEGLSQLWQSTGLLGIIACVFFWFAGLSTINAVHNGHLGMTWTLLRLSMIIPTLASIFYWHEIKLFPVSLIAISRITGILLAVVAVCLMGIDRSRTSKFDKPHLKARNNTKAWAFWMASAFMTQGGWEVTLRATGKLPDEKSKVLFLGIVFIGAMLFSLPVWAIFRPVVGRKELTYGSMAGLCSFIGSGTRPWALEHVPGVIVFPVTTTVVTLGVLICGVLLWREKLGKFGVIGVLVALIGTICLTLRF